MAARAGRPRLRLALDHHYPKAVAEGLQRRGHDARAIAALGWHTLDDERLLARCADEGFVLVTNNIADFAVLARAWQVEGRSHAGLVFTSDASWPRTKAGSGALVRALDGLIGEVASPRAMVNRVRWL